MCSCCRGCCCCCHRAGSRRGGHCRQRLAKAPHDTAARESLPGQESRPGLVLRLSWRHCRERFCATVPRHQACLTPKSKWFWASSTASLSCQSPPPPGPARLPASRTGLASRLPQRASAEPKFENGLPQRRRIGHSDISSRHSGSLASNRPPARRPNVGAQCWPQLLGRTHLLGGALLAGTAGRLLPRMRSAVPPRLVAIPSSGFQPD